MDARSRGKLCDGQAFKLTRVACPPDLRNLRDRSAPGGRTLPSAICAWDSLRV
jgi:hypothetical protein